MIGKDYFLQKSKEIFNKRSPSYKWLGNDYGGFYVNLDNINEDSIIYSFGIGEDISFDKEIIEKTKAKVYGFDPTPKSIEWVKKNEIKGFEFKKYGIGTENGNSKMYLPKNPDHVSGSVLETKNTGGEYVLIELRTLKSIMKELGHTGIDILKMDIEGLEYAVLKNIIKEQIEIGQILVEFHDRFLPDGRRKRKMVEKMLKKHGYHKLAISKSALEISFMHDSLYNKLIKKK